MIINPVNAIALYGRIPTNLEISNYLKQNDTTLNKPWKAKKVQKPPIIAHLVKRPWDSGPQNNNKEWPIQFDGVEIKQVKKLQPPK